MTSAELWAIYVKKNPTMGSNDDTHITLTTRGLRKLFETAYEKGREEGFDNGKAWQKAHPPEEPKPSAPDVFKDLFGKNNPFK